MERAKDLYYEVLSEDLKEIGSGGTNFDFLIQAADKAKRSWVDEKQSLIWQHLNESMIWFDANDVPRVREAGGDQSQTVQTGCKSTLGNSWRVPSLEEVKNAFSGGFKLSTTYKNNSVSKVWSSSISDNGSGVVFGIAYEVKFKLPAEESRWSTASVLCVKNLN